LKGLTRTLLALLCTIGSLFAAPALAGAYPLVGIGDNNTAIFSDPRFLALGITQVRDDIAWNALSVPRARAELAAWLADAQADGLTPLITFDHVVGSVRTQQKLPSVAQFSRAFLTFRKLYPWVKDFETWDEANFYLEGTAFSPQRAAQFYLALRKDCPSCTILASDLLDVPKTEAVPMVHWVAEFIRYAHTQPAYWGLNNYFGANRLDAGTTERLLHAVKGKIWFAETGGIVRRDNGSTVGFTQGAQHAAKVDRFIFNTLARLSPRIQRVYLYEWNAQTAHDKWDSALISWTGATRPAYDVLANTLDSWGIEPSCTISTVPPACATFGGPAAALLRF
jgi:hypothetical protein